MSGREGEREGDTNISLVFCLVVLVGEGKRRGRGFLFAECWASDSVKVLVRCRELEVIKVSVQEMRVGEVGG